MEPEGLLECLKEPATGPCSEPRDASVHSHIEFFKGIFVLPSH
jgi:hypothetical protein